MEQLCRKINMPEEVTRKLVELDSTLTQSGKAADAKAVGDRFDAELYSTETITTNAVSLEWIEGYCWLVDNGTWKAKGEIR